MTVFKITRKKVTFWWGSTATEEYKKNLRKNEEEKSDQARSSTSSFSFGLIKDSPEQNRRICEKLKSGRAIRTLCTKSFAALPPETNGFTISEKNKLIVELRGKWTQLNCLFWTAFLV